MSDSRKSTGHDVKRGSTDKFLISKGNDMLFPENASNSATNQSANIMGN